MMDYMIAHNYTLNNGKELLENKQKCGCCYCERIFESTEIDPEDAEGTVWCPYCGIDAVFGEKQSGIKVTPELLKKMHDYWFEERK